MNNEIVKINVDEVIPNIYQPRKYFSQFYNEWKGKKMKKVLGIDLGSNSTGWAIRNLDLRDNQIEDFGVITFEKGVASEKGNEFPKVQKRTESRGKRRNSCC